MRNDTTDLLLYARLIELHRRKTEAELLGCSSKAHEVLIELYEMELAEVQEARSKAFQATNPDADLSDRKAS
jgi:hypothetical protein